MAAIAGDDTLVGTRNRTTGELKAKIVKGVTPTGGAEIWRIAAQAYGGFVAAKTGGKELGSSVLVVVDEELTQAEIVDLGDVPGASFNFSHSDNAGTATVFFRELGPMGGEKIGQLRYGEPGGVRDFRMYDLDLSVSPSTGINTICGTNFLPFVSPSVAAPDSAFIGVGLAEAEAACVLVPIDEDFKPIGKGGNPEWEIDVLLQDLLEEVEFNYTPENFIDFTDPTFRETRVTGCQMIPPDGIDGWNPQPVVFDHPIFIPPPTMSIELSIDDNTVKVILKNTLQDKIYDFLIGDLSEWRVLLGGVLGTGGDISLDYPIDSPRQFFNFDERDDDP